MIRLATTVGGKKFDVTGRGRVAEPAGERVSPANTPPETEKSLPLVRATLVMKEPSALLVTDWPS